MYNFLKVHEKEKPLWTNFQMQFISKDMKKALIFAKIQQSDLKLKKKIKRLPQDRTKVWKSGEPGVSDNVVGIICPPPGTHVHGSDRPAIDASLAIERYYRSNPA